MKIKRIRATSKNKNKWRKRWKSGKQAGSSIFLISSYFIILSHHTNVTSYHFKSFYIISCHIVSHIVFSHPTSTYTYISYHITARYVISHPTSTYIIAHQLTSHIYLHLISCPPLVSSTAITYTYL